MKLRNRHGTPIDPVPLLVVAGLVVMVCFSFGPGYCLTLGLSLTAGLVVSTVVCGVGIGLAYYRFVRTFRPECNVELAAEERLQPLIYGAVICIALLVLLSIPLLV